MREREKMRPNKGNKSFHGAIQAHFYFCLEMNMDLSAKKYKTKSLGECLHRQLEYHHKAYLLRQSFPVFT